VDHFGEVKEKLTWNTIFSGKVVEVTEDCEILVRFPKKKTQ
jgi:hypothetical protein